MSKLTHLDASGAARMVDVGNKAETLREARAGARVRMAAPVVFIVVGGVAGFYNVAIGIGISALTFGAISPFSSALLAPAGGLDVLPGVDASAAGADSQAIVVIRRESLCHA